MNETIQNQIDNQWNGEQWEWNGKFMSSIFLDAGDVIFIDYLEKVPRDQYWIHKHV